MKQDKTIIQEQFSQAMTPGHCHKMTGINKPSPDLNHKISSCWSYPNCRPFPSFPISCCKLVRFNHRHGEPEAQSHSQSRHFVALYDRGSRQLDSTRHRLHRRESPVLSKFPRKRAGVSVSEAICCFLDGMRSEQQFHSMLLPFFVEPLPRASALALQKISLDCSYRNPTMFCQIRYRPSRFLRQLLPVLDVVQGSIHKFGLEF